MLSFQDELLTMKEAAKRLPTVNGKPVHPSAIWRWCRKGIKGISLEYMILGGRYLTTMDAIEIFCNKLARRELETNNDKEGS